MLFNLRKTLLVNKIEQSCWSKVVINLGKKAFKQHICESKGFPIFRVSEYHNAVSDCNQTFGKAQSKDKINPDNQYLLSCCQNSLSLSVSFYVKVQANKEKRMNKTFNYYFKGQLYRCNDFIVLLWAICRFKTKIIVDGKKYFLSYQDWQHSVFDCIMLTQNLLVLLLWFSFYDQLNPVHLEYHKIYTKVEHGIYNSVTYQLDFIKLRVMILNQ